MDISFTGINNLYIGKKAYSKFGTYLGEDRKLKQGKKFYTEIKMKCNLTNDAQGNDLEDFQKTLSRCRPCYQFNCIDRLNPDKFELHMKRFDVKDDFLPATSSSFDINNYEIMFDEKQILPMVDFMARLTRKLSKSNDLTEQQRKVMSFINQSIADRAEDFIESLF